MADNIATMREKLKSVKENPLDKVVTWINPVTGLRRLKARQMLAISGGYTGASKSRRGLKQYKPGSGSADADILPDLDDLRGRSRDLVRNNTIGGGAVNRVVTNVVGSGLKLNAKINRTALNMTEEQAREFEARVEWLFSIWAEDETVCDLARESTFYQQQDVAFRSSLESGDCFVLMPWHVWQGNPYGLKLQVIEGDRVSNPKCQRDSETLKAGIIIDKATGAPTGCHIRTTHPGETGITGALKWDWEERDFFNQSGRRTLLHLYRKLRPGQHRGVPYLAPVIEHIKQIGEYTDAEVMAAVIAGMFTVFIKSEGGTDIDPLAATEEAGITKSDAEVGLGYGTIVDGMAPGDTIETANPGRPNDSFDPFVKAILSQIGMALELPREVLTMSFESSYSAARAAFLEAWRFFRGRREWLAVKFCQPVYEAWMTEAVSRGHLYAPGFFSSPELRKAYLGATWIGAAPGQIDPVKEVNAAKGRLELDLTTRNEESIALTGEDWDSKTDRMKGEKETLKDINGGNNENTGQAQDLPLQEGTK